MGEPPKLKIDHNLLVLSFPSMVDFSSTTKLGILKFEQYLRNNIKLDLMSNLNLHLENVNLLNDIEPTIISFFTWIDPRKDYDLGDRFKSYKNGSTNVHMLLSYETTKIISLIPDFSLAYTADAKSRLFSIAIGTMTGKQFDEYLQLIGLLK